MHNPLLSFVSFISLGLALVMSAEPTISPYVVHEKRTAIPPDWSLVHCHHASSMFPLCFALKQRNIEKIGDFLLDVSHPDSPNYGNHCTPSDIIYKFSLSADTVDTVCEWLLSMGIDPLCIQLSPSRGWINVNVFVEEAEHLLQTEYNVYKHVSSTEHVACEAYHLPGHVSHHVDFVLPSVHFDARIRHCNVNQPPIKARQPGNGFDGPKTSGSLQVNSPQLEQCDMVITPECLKALYGLYYDPIVTEKNSYRIIEYTPQSFVQSDPQMFAKNFSTDLIGKSPVLVSIDSGRLHSFQTLHRCSNHTPTPGYNQTRYKPNASVHDTQPEQACKEVIYSRRI
ncbi:Pro-kumamolisin, activation domain-containing protein [Pisolithus marmoratus]|nr:Pro-kumamolisin, activation domain-containing protein [Pisolithus marmoratus]